MRKDDATCSLSRMVTALMATQGKYRKGGTSKAKQLAFEPIRQRPHPPPPPPFFIHSVIIANTFRPIVGKAVLGSVTVVEFLSDRRCDFLTDDGAYWQYEVGDTAQTAALTKYIISDSPASPYASA
ncbi:hypothetical protein JZ751_018539 [Albula glossodonta]|uniref:Lysine-specific demethylase 3B PWWP domain-containing protein n=1 Tax=Albula glossodonta TaxID=121402 RepID=A0A8T2NZL9_9TELE|nr:hypothetical protein JZ751_018539 [Albula glossodonta]